MPPYRIPFNQPTKAVAGLDYLRRALAAGRLSAGGHFSERCCELLSQELDDRPVVLTTSCTTALEMAASLLEIAPGDEVILPAFTFVSTANAFLLRGARPVFVDVRPDTLGLDETLIAERITPRTRAIVPVHYAGVGCEMTAIVALADRHRIAVVEDNAHGLFGSYRGRRLGTWGAMATLSFHETKNVTCGEGGALVIGDDSLRERAEVFAYKGTDRLRMIRGLSSSYTWVGLGSSVAPSELLAAVLCAQLEDRQAIQARRRRVWERYADRLAPWAAANDWRLPVVPAHCEQSFHMFYLLAPSGEQRDRLIAHLAARSILAVFHYLPLHLSPMGRRLGGRPGDCPVTERTSARLLRLPFFTELGDEDQEAVVKAVEAFVS